jgi:hypothetical protein
VTTQPQKKPEKPTQPHRSCSVCGRREGERGVYIAVRAGASFECRNCYRRRRRAEDGRYNYEARTGKRAEQKRAWDSAHRRRAVA